MTIEEYKTWFSAHYHRTSSLLTASAFIFFDIIAVMICIGLGFFAVNAFDKTLINFKSFIMYSVYLPVFIIAYYAAKLYPGILMAPAEEFKKLCIANFFVYCGIAVSIVFETDGKEPIAVALLISLLFSAVIMTLSRELARKFYSKFRWWGIPAVIIGSGKTTKMLINKLLDYPFLGYRPIAIVSDTQMQDTDYRDIPIFYEAAAFFDLAKKLNIKMAISTPDSMSKEFYDQFVLTNLKNFRYSIIIPEKDYFSTFSMAVRDFNGILGLATTQNLTKPATLFVKRVIDILLLIIGSIFFIPIGAIIAVLIKITSSGPVFYGHTRLGKNGKPFKAWKFRSMVQNADKTLEKILETNPEAKAEWDKNQKLSNDPRITSIGKLLRKTSLDELPQLWNILKGEMSFVGPRPIVTAEIAKYEGKFDYIFSVKPGLSGMWQISGRSDTNYAQRVTFDMYYIQNWSIWLDMWIILKTVAVVLLGHGAY